MAVYVDQMKAPYRGMIMCHMFADSKAELVAMCETIGVNPKWIQKEGTYQEHMDISLAKKKLALSAGAIEIDRKAVGEILKARREGRNPVIGAASGQLTLF